jgi:ABC-type transporter Mla maintaining outer membrane lipid asymmetry permease subunit MlaE
VGGRVGSGITAELRGHEGHGAVDALRAIGSNYIKARCTKVAAATLVFLLTVIADAMGILAAW